MARCAGSPITRSVAELADLLRADPVLKELARALTGTAEPDLGAVIGGLIPDEAVPFLAATATSPRYREVSARGRGVWALQRREDAGEKGSHPGAAEVRPERLREGDVLEGPGQARRAQGALHRLPRTWHAKATRRRCSAGPVGTTATRRSLLPVRFLSSRRSVPTMPRWCRWSRAGGAGALAGAVAFRDRAAVRR